MVSGRLFPVEQRWRPFEERKDDNDLDDAIADAVDELWREGSGDVLVFLPGEREIREAADHLRRHLAQSARGARRDPAALRAPVAGRSRTASSRPATGAASCWRRTSPRPR